MNRRTQQLRIYTLISVQFILDLLFICFMYLVVYRRIIEPFTEGYRGKQRAYNQQKGTRVFPKESTHLHPTEIEETTKPVVIDAEFTEIPTSEKAD